MLKTTTLAGPDHAALIWTLHGYLRAGWVVRDAYTRDLLEPRWHWWSAWVTYYYYELVFITPLIDELTAKTTALITSLEKNS